MSVHPQNFVNEITHSSKAFFQQSDTGLEARLCNEKRGEGVLLVSSS